MSKRISKANNIKYALSGDNSYIASVDPDQINLMRTLGASKFQIFRKLVVPA